MDDNQDVTTAGGSAGRDYLDVLRKRWWVILLVVLIGGGAGAAISYSSTPQYQSTASVYFAVQSGGTAADLSQSGNFAQSQMPTFASFATLPVVLDPVIKQLGLKQTAAGLAKSISVATSSTTVIIDVTASDPVPAQAARIANAVAKQLGTVVTTLSVRNAAGQPTVTSQTVAPALAATSPYSPRTERNIAAGLLAGLLLGYLLAYAWQRLDTRVRSVRDATDTLGAPLLGQIWTDRSLTKGHQVMVDGATGPLAEAIRSIRTNLQFLRIDGRPLVTIVSSALSGEGKTTTSINLAIALAETEATVLLIDADLRRPSVASKLGLEGAAGLTTVLIGQAGFAEVVQAWGFTGLDILPSGQVPPNPSELLGSSAMRELLAHAAARYDYVLLDSAPLLPVTDTAVLAMSGFGTVLVAAAGEVSRPQLKQAAAAISRVGGETLGVVVNKLPHRSVQRAAYTYAATDEVPPVAAVRPIRHRAAAEVDPAGESGEVPVVIESPAAQTPHADADAGAHASAELASRQHDRSGRAAAPGRRPGRLRVENSDPSDL